MAYADEVLRLRREIRSLHRQLGDREGTDNSDIFGEREIGAKELKELQDEQRVLSQRLVVEENRADVRRRAYAELEMGDTDEKPRHIPRKPQPPDNSDILLTNEQMRKLEKNV